ncbi:MAG: helix-hairpin-helix domain-containing protein [Chitinophagaceae bacterium]
MALDNAFIADQFSLLSKILDIHGEDPFKSRAYGSAAFAIEQLPVPLHQLPREELASLKGIGPSTSKKITEILDTGVLADLQALLAKTPPGILEMLRIKGLGPKKISVIWKQMGLETLGELQYACEENRLLLFKGFGAKTQENIKQAIEFYQQHQGKFLYAEVEALLPSIQQFLGQGLGTSRIAYSGAFRRQATTLDEMEWVVLLPNEKIKPLFQTERPPLLLEESPHHLLYQLQNGLKLKLSTGGDHLAGALLRTTGPASFLQWFEKKSKLPITQLPAASREEELFQSAGLPWIPPFLRDWEDPEPFVVPEKLRQLVTPESIKGIIHTHSNWSDGVNTLEEMAAACRDKGWEYLVVSDHSKSAAYAGGLPEKKIQEQHKQINELNQRLAPFRIFKSIECDILGDGSLDYSDDVLASFDLVIASVHSHLTMTEEKAMSRLLKAIENPYTTILGHLTGRLLLSRAGYPLQMKKIIDACAAHQVVIEINAHPRRLDLDWSWIPYALEKTVLLSINPDAHSIEGMNDCRYGVLAAQKGGLPTNRNLSSFSLKEFENFLKQRKKK